MPRAGAGEEGGFSALLHAYKKKCKCRGRAFEHAGPVELARASAGVLLPIRARARRRMRDLARIVEEYQG